MLVAESDRASLPLQMYGIFRAVMKACVAVFAVVGEDDTVCHCNIVCGADLCADATFDAVVSYYIALCRIGL